MRTRPHARFYCFATCIDNYRHVPGGVDLDLTSETHPPVTVFLTRTSILRLAREINEREATDANQ